MSFNAEKEICHSFKFWSDIFFYYAFEFYLFSLIAACAAANLAIGTLNGEHDT